MIGRRDDQGSTTERSEVGPERPRAGITVAVRPTVRRLLMCEPAHFAVTYDINPWMAATLRSTEGVDRSRAQRQWHDLVATYRALGHVVELIPPRPALPDMVFAANAATVIGGRVLSARYRHVQRAGEERWFREWFAQHGFDDVRTAVEVNEGEGDLLFAGDLLLAGHGFRTSLAAHAEAAWFFDLPVVSLRLIDPAYYHLDTALAVLGPDNIAWYPPAFAPESRAVLHDLFPHSVIADAVEAEVLGLNLWCDGRHVVLPPGAVRLAGELRQRGFEPVTVDVSELRRAGGGIKCCTLELRS